MTGLLNLLKKFPVVWLWLIFVFLVSGLVINIVQVVLLPLWLVHRNLYRWININIVYLHWCQLTFLTEWWGGLDLKLYGRREDYEMFGSENAVCIANHRSDVDWLIGWVMAERAGVLGATKCYMKSYLKFLPIIGFSWWCTEYAFVSRNWEKDQKVLLNSIKTLKEFPYPFWMVIFAEGTRLTKAKLQSSQEYARSKGLPELKHHLLPRPRGFAVTVHNFKGKVSYIYDLEVAFPNNKEPTVLKFLKGEGGPVHLWIRRVAVEEIPTDTVDQTSEWCRELFRRKDEAMSYFIDHGTFPAERIEYPRGYKNIITASIWHLLMSVILLYYIIPFVASGSMFALGVVGMLLLTGFVVMRILLHFSDSKRGSNFGLSSTAGKKAESSNNGVLNHKITSKKE